MAVHSVSYIILIKFMTLLLQVKDIRRHKQDIKQKECDEGNVYPVIAGILTSGFPLVLLGACARVLVTSVHETTVK